MDDLIIRGAQVIDSSSAPGRMADVAMADGPLEVGALCLSLYLFTASKVSAST